MSGHVGPSAAGWHSLTPWPPWPCASALGDGAGRDQRPASPCQCRPLLLRSLTSTEATPLCSDLAQRPGSKAWTEAQARTKCPQESPSRETPELRLGSRTTPGPLGATGKPKTQADQGRGRWGGPTHARVAWVPGQGPGHGARPPHRPHRGRQESPGFLQRGWQGVHTGTRRPW